MAAIRFTNAMSNEEILNLDNLTAVERPKSQKSLLISFGKEHTHINFRTVEERDLVFEKISEAYGVKA